MKKSKVDRIIKAKMAEARAQGIAEGKLQERRANERFFGRPGRDGVIWLMSQDTLNRRRTVFVRAREVFGYGEEPFSIRPYEEDQRIDFDAVPMALSLTNGQMIRWLHWRPVGPYPVSELGVVR